MACSISSIPQSILPPGQARTSAHIWSLFSTPLILRRSGRLYRRFNTSWVLAQRWTVMTTCPSASASHLFGHDQEAPLAPSPSGRGDRRPWPKSLLETVLDIIE